MIWDGIGWDMMLWDGIRFCGMGRSGDLQVEMVDMFEVYRLGIHGVKKTYLFIVQKGSRTLQITTALKEFVVTKLMADIF